MVKRRSFKRSFRKKKFGRRKFSMKRRIHRNKRSMRRSRIRRKKSLKMSFYFGSKAPANWGGDMELETSLATQMGVFLSADTGPLKTLRNLLMSSDSMSSMQLSPMFIDMSQGSEIQQRIWQKLVCKHASSGGVIVPFDVDGYPGPEIPNRPGVYAPRDPSEPWNQPHYPHKYPIRFDFKGFKVKCPQRRLIQGKLVPMCAWSSNSHQGAQLIPFISGKLYNRTVPEFRAVTYHILQNEHGYQTIPNAVNDTQNRKCYDCPLS